MLGVSVENSKSEHRTWFFPELERVRTRLVEKRAMPKLYVIHPHIASIVVRLSETRTISETAAQPLAGCRISPVVPTAYRAAETRICPMDQPQ